MPNISTKPTQLPEELGMYLDGLRKRYAAIDEVWLLGPRVNDDDKRGSEWDLLAFGDRSTLSDLRQDESAHRDDVKLLVVTDGDRFESAWGTPRAGRLSELGWRVEDLHSASYAADGASRDHAVRVR